MKTILVTEPDEIDSQAIDVLKKNKYTIVLPKEKKDLTIIDGLFIRTYTQATKQYLSQFPKLSFILRAGVGLDNIDLAECKKRNIQVFNAPGSNANSVAEYVITTMLMALRNISQQMEQIKNKKWREKQYIGEEIQKKTIGLIGCGAIGKLIAKKLKNFNVTVIGYDPFIDKETLTKHFIEKHTLDYVIKHADILSLHLPLLPETKHMFTKKELQQMKPTSFLINAARGELVKEIDLIEVLQKKQIAGAVLDVFPNEPEINPAFLALDNVILTPHIAGFTKEADTQMAIGAVENFLKENN